MCSNKNNGSCNGNDITVLEIEGENTYISSYELVVLCSVRTSKEIGCVKI